LEIIFIESLYGTIYACQFTVASTHLAFPLSGIFHAPFTLIIT